MSARDPHHIDVAIGARIRLMRNQRGLSQIALGHKCGVTFQQIQKYESGANRVGCSRLVQIAKALGIPPAWFFEDYGPAGDSSSLLTEALNENQRLTATFKALGELLKGEAK
ncbi:helix-turn-helix transcriptional regulator [Rhizobium sp. CFBP 8762]|uniref:helix-turn-helix domain-containing protein n=1 Tax=Rhizobium sp. CFBP 8762 TaxID=2775279 RepID=UPI00177D9A53|nr:helix-turn-helix transcriptional regulator [Rhizobium sp. CFBP 8762]MBD8556876.1 helix-turn-helix transcriptional regulator [Rhizobium sp. CFBP 8762]